MPTQREVCTLTDGVPSCDTGPAGVYGSSSPNCVMWSASCAGRCTGARTGLASIRAVLRHGEVGSLAEKNLAGRVAQRVRARAAEITSFTVPPRVFLSSLTSARSARPMPRPLHVPGQPDCARIPQWPRQVQRLGHHPPGERSQLLVAARIR